MNRFPPHMTLNIDKFNLNPCSSQSITDLDCQFDIIQVCARSWVAILRKSIPRMGPLQKQVTDLLESDIHYGSDAWSLLKKPGIAVLNTDRVPKPWFKNRVPNFQKIYNPFFVGFFFSFSCSLRNGSPIYAWKWEPVLCFLLTPDYCFSLYQVFYFILYYFISLFSIFRFIILSIYYFFHV